MPMRTACAMVQVLAMGLILFGLVVLFVDASGRHPSAKSPPFPGQPAGPASPTALPPSEDDGLECRRPASTEVRSTIVQTEDAVGDGTGSMWRIVSQLLALRRTRTSFHHPQTERGRERDLARNRRHSMPPLPLDDSRWALRLRRSV